MVLVAEHFLRTRYGLEEFQYAHLSSYRTIDDITINGKAERIRLYDSQAVYDLAKRLGKTLPPQPVGELVYAEHTFTICPLLDRKSRQARSVVCCPHCKTSDPDRIFESSLYVRQPSPSATYVLDDQYPDHLRDVHGIEFSDGLVLST